MKLTNKQLKVTTLIGIACTASASFATFLDNAAQVPKEVKVISLDLKKTLVKEKFDEASLMVKVMREVLGHKVVEDMQHFPKKAYDRIWDEHDRQAEFKRVLATKSEEKLSGFYVDFLHDWLRQIDYAPKDEKQTPKMIAEDLWKAFKQYRYDHIEETYGYYGDTPVFRFVDYVNQNLPSDIKPALDMMLKKGYLIAGVDNWDYGQADCEEILKRLGLKDYFTHISTSLSSGVQKPEIGIFEHSFKGIQQICFKDNHYRITPNMVVHVGNEYDKDKGARGAGQYTLVYNSAGTFTKREAIKDLKTLADMLQDLGNLPVSSYN